MTQVTGIVQEVNNRGKGKGSNILVNGAKYGCFDPLLAHIDTLVAGEEVTFGTVVNGTWTNIDRSGVSKTGNTGAVTAAPPSAPKKGGGAYGKAFPIPPLDGQRSIVRQNSLTHATALVNNYYSLRGSDTNMTLAERTALVIHTAKSFEAYSCGDDVEKEASEAVAQLGQSQNTQ